jgi:hypothetical protein
MPISIDDAATTPTVTPTSTAVITLPSKADDDFVQNTGQTQPGHSGSRSNTGGPNVLALSLGISTSAILLFGGGLFWLYLRRNQQNVATLQKWNQQGVATLQKWNQQGITALHKWRKPGPIANTSWMGGGNRATSSLPDPATFTASIPSKVSSPHETTGPLPGSKESIVPEANMHPSLISLSPTDPTGPAYRPSDLRPMTMALPKQIVNQQASDLAPYPATSNMNPLPLDALDLAYSGTKPTELEHTSGEPPTTPAEPISPPEKNSSTVPENTPMSATVERPPVQLLDVAGDPMLENVMRQAQLGLFVTPGHEKS